MGLEMRVAAPFVDPSEPSHRLSNQWRRLSGLRGPGALPAFSAQAASELEADHPREALRHRGWRGKRLPTGGRVERLPRLAVFEEERHPRRAGIPIEEFVAHPEVAVAVGAEKRGT